LAERGNRLTGSCSSKATSEPQEASAPKESAASRPYHSRCQRVLASPAQTKSSAEGRRPIATRLLSGTAGKQRRIGSRPNSRGSTQPTWGRLCNRRIEVLASQRRKTKPGLAFTFTRNRTAPQHPDKPAEAKSFKSQFCQNDSPGISRRRPRQRQRVQNASFARLIASLAVQPETDRSRYPTITR
jgi:hypothetical protein